MALFAPTDDHPALEALRVLQPDELSPRAALETLYALKALSQRK